MDHPKDIGDRSTLAVMLVLSSLGYPMFLPFGENTRCDLLIDEGERLARVQVKTGRLRVGAVIFNVCSCYGHHRNPSTHRRSYEGQIEYFAVYCPQTAGVYLVPIAELAVRTVCALRVEPPRNNQRNGVRLAETYEIGRVKILARAEPAGSAGGR